MFRAPLSFLLAALLLAGCAPQAPAPSGNPGPGFPVHASIVTDRHGVPHISARDQASLFFALGYVEGRDRLWQLHLWRCTAEGRSSELLGNGALQSDGLFRGLDVAGRCRRGWAQLPGDSPFARRARAFAAGLNHYIDQVNRGLQPLPREFRVAGARPEPWTGIQCLEIEFLQGAAMDLGTAQAGRDAAARREGAAAVVRRWELSIHDVEYSTLSGPPGSHGTPGAPAPGSPGAPPGGELPVAAAPPPGTDAEPSPIPRLWGPGASNEFAVDGRRTVSGKPLLANDAHLKHTTPSEWYAVTLEVPDTLLAGGFALPGVPLLASGRNRAAAWGVTALGADVSAVYAESLSADGRSVLRADRWERVRETPLGLRWRLGPVRFPLFWVKARTTSHGLLISEDRRARRALALDWYPMHPYPLALGALEPERAATAREAVDAFQGVPTPGLNVVAADRDGHLAYRSVGWVPRQSAGLPPLPARGADPASAWADPIPADEMPAGQDPTQGYFINCNNRPAGPDYPYAMGTYFMEYRARRVDDLLRAAGPLDVAGIQRVQLDTFSPQWKRFAAHFLARTASQRLSEEAERARMALAAYDGRPDSMSLAPMIFRTWYAETRARLGQGAFDGYLETLLGEPGGFGLPVTRAPGAAVHAASAAADSTTGERFARLLAGTLEKAVQRLHHRFGPLGEAWAWGRNHRAHFEHALEGRDRAFAPPEPWVAGDNLSVNVASMSLTSLPLVTHGPSMRQISDLSQDSTMWMVLPPGNSGDSRSPHYFDMLQPWAAGQYFELRLGAPLPESVESVVKLDLPGPR